MRCPIVLPLVLAMACSNYKADFPAEQPDAPRESDDVADAQTVVRGPVSVRVADRGTPVFGVRVWFVDPDGALVASTTTDAGGIATADVPAGSSVTAVQPFAYDDGNARLFTTLAVQPGDVVRYERPGSGGGSPQQRSAEISIRPDPGAADHIVFGTCFGYGSGSVYEYLIDGRVRFGHGLVNGVERCDLFVASRDEDGRLLRGFYLRDIELPLDVQRPPITIDEPYRPLAQHAIEIMHAPAEVAAVEIAYSLATPNGLLMRIPRHIEVVDGKATLRFAVPPGVAFDARIEGVVLSPLANRRTFARWGASSPTYTLDFETLFVAGFAGRPAWNGSALVWPASPGLPTDVAAFVVEGLRQSSETRWLHTIAAPAPAATAASDGSASELALPKLPVEDFDYNFRPSDTTFVRAARSARVGGGYDAIREIVLAGQAFDDTTIIGTAGTSATAEFPWTAYGTDPWGNGL